jgi:hypothetical protein
MRGSAFAAAACIFALGKGGNSIAAAMPMQMILAAVNYAERCLKYQHFCVWILSKRDIHAG